jgi:hypothetical protein
VERKVIVLFQERLAAAFGGETIAFAGRALPEVAEPAEVAVGARLKQENLDFVNRWSMASLGNDFSNDAATGAPQFIQPVEPRHPRREIDIPTFVGDW